MLESAYVCVACSLTLRSEEHAQSSHHSYQCQSLHLCPTKRVNDVPQSNRKLLSVFSSSVKASTRSSYLLVTPDNRLHMNIYISSTV